MIQCLRIFFDFVIMDENGSTSIKNLKNLTCYPRKMILIALVRTKITSLGSCSCVFVDGRLVHLAISLPSTFAHI
jgi:hypothetical protein